MLNRYVKSLEGASTARLRVCQQRKVMMPMEESRALGRQGRAITASVLLFGRQQAYLGPYL